MVIIFQVYTYYISNKHNNSMQPEEVLTRAHLGKFVASKRIVKESFSVLLQDKEIVVFPILSCITTLVATCALGALYFVLFLSTALQDMVSINQGTHFSDFAYLMLFIDYVLIMFIVGFFQAGLYSVVQARFSGQNTTFSYGISVALRKAGKIFVWSLVSATVGIILQIIADKFKLAGRIIASLCGAAWNILTFFSLPALVADDIGVFDAYKESASVIRKKWGETIIINFGTGLVFFFTYLALFGFFIIAMVIAPSPVTFIVGSLLLIGSILVLSIISSTLNSIFKMAIFMYAKTGEIPQGFSEDIIKGAVDMKGGVPKE